LPASLRSPAPPQQADEKDGQEKERSPVSHGHPHALKSWITRTPFAGTPGLADLRDLLVLDVSEELGRVLEDLIFRGSML